MKIIDYLVLGAVVLAGALLFFLRQCQLDSLLFLILLAAVFFCYFLLSRPVAGREEPSDTRPSDEETPDQT